MASSRVLFALVAFVSACSLSTVQVSAPSDRTDVTLRAVVGLLDDDGDSYCTGTMVGGYVLTAAHCIHGDVVNVGFYSEYTRSTETWSASHAFEVVESDEATDLALLKSAESFPAWSYTNLYTAPENLVFGQRVSTIGHPRGLHYSYAEGSVSAASRNMLYSRPLNWTQVSVPVSPGNSGGPLLNRYGEIVGVCSFRIASRGGSEPHLAGFIHLSEVRRLLDKHGVTHGIHP